MTTHTEFHAAPHAVAARSSLWARVRTGAGMAWQRMACSFHNTRRRWLKRRLPDYVVITINGGLLERDPETPWYYDFVPGYRGPQTLEGICLLYTSPSPRD